MIRLLLGSFAWVLIPLGLWLMAQHSGTPHLRWVRLTSATGQITACRYLGPTGYFERQVLAENCPVLVFRKGGW